MPQFGGTAHELPEWKFRIKTKMSYIEKAKPEERDKLRAEMASNIIDSLTDDALKLAMDIGVDEICERGGVEKLIAAIETHVTQSKDDEARELFHAGTRPDGPLCRQHGEAMQSYITRRKRWYDRMHLLDGTYTVSEPILTDYLLDNARLTNEQKLMIRTVCGNRRKFDEIATALKHQHARIHEREKGGAREQNTPKGGGTF